MQKFETCYQYSYRKIYFNNPCINLCIIFVTELEGMVDMNSDEQYILSDPESEWKQEKNSTCSTEDEDSDRPESDQPYNRLEHISKLSTT